MQYPVRAYQHKKDRESFINLKSVSWITAISKRVIGEDLEQDFYLLNLMDNVKMTEQDFPQIHQYVDDACQKLMLPYKPTLFLDTDADPKTICIGEKKPMLVISNALIELLDEKELQAAIAHEIGHLVCGHSFHKILVENFSGLTQVMGAVPGLTALSIAARLPLFEWFRKADLTADRAALLVVENPEVVQSMIGKLAGGSSQMAERVSQENLLNQCDEIEELTEKLKSGGAMDKMSYLFSSAVMNGIMRKSPWPAMRIKEIRDWSCSTQYAEVRNGIFPKDEAEVESEPETDQEDEKTTSAFDKLMFWKKDED